MNFPARPFALVIILLVLLAACGPGTPAPTPTPKGPVDLKPIPLPNAAVTFMSPALALPCTPPVPAMGEASSYCANQVKGVGGATYSDLTNLQTDGTGSWLVGDSITGNVSCNLDQGTSMATCTGTQNATFQAMVCSSCTIPNVSASDNYVCSKGYGLEADQKTCNYVDPSKANHYEFCPPGSLYDNALQNCVDNVTNKLASPCPPGYPIFSPDTHRCLIKAQAVFNCQTFPMNLGACIPPKQAAIKVVPFCQNNEASMGGANITYPAGSTLSVDTQGSHLQSCTPGGTQPAGTQLFTCFGVAGNGFDVQLCKDPATCTTYHATLGTCPVKKNKPGTGAPAGTPMCNPRLAPCP